MQPSQTPIYTVEAYPKDGGLCISRKVFSAPFLVHRVAEAKSRNRLTIRVGHADPAIPCKCGRHRGKPPPGHDVKERGHCALSIFQPRLSKSCLKSGDNRIESKYSVIRYRVECASRRRGRHADIHSKVICEGLLDLERGGLSANRVSRRPAVDSTLFNIGRHQQGRRKQSDRGEALT